MKTIPHREAKFYYLANRQAHLCPIAEKYGKVALVDNELHHRYTDTNAHRRKCPLFINSLLNLVAVNHGWHISHPGALGLTDYQAMRYEKFLERHLWWANFFNNPDLAFVHRWQKAVAHVEE
jgi:hypothetical protein